MYEAQATGLQRLVGSFGGDARALLSYTMLEKGVYEKLAEANAKAIKDLNPKITVWTHDPNTSMSAIQNLGKALIPMLDTMEDQTGYKMPSWVLEKKELQ
jgi:flotillin